MADVSVGAHTLTLLPERAAFLPGLRSLLIADAHIGKAVSFRALGVPVPRGTTTETLGLLSRLVERTNAVRVIFLGDFLHSARSHAAATQAAVAQWRERHARLALTLVRGNHDDRAGDPPGRLGFEVVDEPLVLGGLALCHHPLPHDGLYTLAGHRHPCITVTGRAHDRLRLPCFHFGAQVGVLPAFGSFTGMHPIQPREGDRVFVVADDEVRAVNRGTTTP
jgi:DNA ligase-associated metallophosphoesterase